jgi:hypothetical protein
MRILLIALAQLDHKGSLVREANQVRSDLSDQLVGAVRLERKENAEKLVHKVQSDHRDCKEYQV